MIALKSRLLPSTTALQPPTDPVVTTYILLWGSVHEPFIKKMRGDEDYLRSYTKGFAELPTPAQVHTDTMHCGVCYWKYC